jgi:site-specific DNA-adenine methylase
MITSSGEAALAWLTKLAARLERVRIIHGDWDRCLNAHYGGTDTAYFFDPPYKAYEKLYGTDSKSIALRCADTSETTNWTAGQKCAGRASA